MNNEKICPLTQRTCYREECGMWHDKQCAVVALADAAQEIKPDIFWIRRAVEEQFC